MQTVATTAQTWGETLRASLANALTLFFGAIPRIIAFVLILVIGWFIASLIAKGIAALLRAVHFNDLAQRAGIADFVTRMGVRSDSSGVLATVAKWFIRLITLVVAFDALGLPAVSGVLQRFLLWLPNLFVALVVLVIGGLLAGAASRVVRGAASEGGFTNPNLLAGITKVAIWGFAIIVAVDQVGIAATVVNTIFMGFVAFLVLAFGLAFGLGGREVAARIWDDFYGQAQQAGPKIHQAAQTAGRTARRWDETPPRPEPMRADEPPRRGE